MNVNKNAVGSELYHILTVPEALSQLDTAPEGLIEAEVINRLHKFGKNELQEGKKKTLIGMFLLQFKDLMIIILIIAAVIAGFLGEVTDTAIIMLVVLINAVLGVAQESKAEKALAALRKMSSPSAKVKRNGEVKVVKSEDIVPGDIILVEAGDYIPADVRLLEVASLKIEEAALTGESVPVEKTIAEINDADIVIGDRKNMAYLGTSVTYGRGIGVITATGMSTEVGKIAENINTALDEETPLQRKLAELGKYLSVGVVIIAIIIFAAGILQARDTLEMFLVAVSLAVAAIPEGLPAIVTIVLAIGVQKMAKQNAIIRKLSAVETLGSTEIICSDKTGTLTLNKMTIQEIYLGDKLIDADAVLQEESSPEIFMQGLNLCNDSKVKQIDQTSIQTIGDPTETALVDFAFQKGFHMDVMENSYPRVAEFPFDSDRKLMTTVNQVDGKLRVLTKGAPDVLLSRCSRILIKGQIQSINEKVMNEINQANKNMAVKALRVLAIAYKDIELLPDDSEMEKTENDLIFIGLAGMIDPLRQEAREAVRICKEAGIRAIMITGDHRDTAAAIAKGLGMIMDESEVITGAELDRISVNDFIQQVSKYSVYARVSPEHKVRIVNAWKKNAKVVAMTGDGVNDAPALKAADIGVGMGITGTDVAKGVSDMVLADDNFATIVLAVEEGRKIYSNIRKAIQFLLSANTGEVLTLFIATMLNWSILFPIHILWINLVTDTFPALALGVEKGEAEIMKQPPRKSTASIFADGVGSNILYQGFLQALITLGAYYIGIIRYSPETAVTMAFATLGLIQLTHSYNVRSNTKSIFQQGLLSNKYLLGATLLSGLLMVGVIIIPGLSNLFRVSHLSLEQWALVGLLSVSIIPMVEIVKLFKRKNT
jgi:Ca2+-transporting ATPase